MFFTKPEHPEKEGIFKDLITEHMADAATPERRRFRIGQSIPSLPQHGMCSGSSGGLVVSADVFAVVAECRACKARVRIDNL